MNGPEGFSARLKQLRETLRLSQKDMAGSVGGSQRAWADYEAGRTMPGAAMLAVLAERGFDIHWLLLGQGAMRRGPAGGVDEALLVEVIQAIEQFLEARGGHLDPDKKAMVVKEVYMRIVELEAAGGDRQAVRHDVVDRLVRLAS